jgi:predicted nucleotidyltransferase
MRLTELKERRAEILSTAARYGACNVRVFGSVARGDSSAASDVDFVVELKPGRSLLDHVGLWQDLEELLGCKVDLVEPEGLHWYIKDRVLSEAILL